MLDPEDLERVVDALAEIARLLEAVTHILERAIGRSMEEAEAIPGDRHTDRAGLLDDEGED